MRFFSQIDRYLVVRVVVLPVFCQPRTHFSVMVPKVEKELKPRVV